jgi:hypothetical protein
VRPLDSDLWDWVDRQPTHSSHRPLIPGPHGRHLVEALCGWELVALLTGLVPTVTAIVQPHQRRTAVRAAVLVALGALAHHLLIESPICQPKEKSCPTSVR